MGKHSRREVFSRSWLKGVIVSAALMMGLVPAMAFGATDGTTEVDPSTGDNLSVLQSESTLREGFMWTDKSVYDDDATVSGLNGATVTVQKGDADFLVGLSAMSSTAAIDGMTSQPLDIVLVLDVSGSMDQSLGYAPVYSADLNTNGTYYIKSGVSYKQLSYSRTQSKWYYQDKKNNVYITPTTSASDTNSGHTQVYRVVSRIDSLKTAVNAFIGYTAELNDEIDDAENQHRISIVKFSGNSTTKVGNSTYTRDGYTYNYTQVVKGLTTVTSSTKSTLTSAVNGLAAAGATRSDYGLELAQDVLANGRSNAQKVVIFYTDGQPTSYNEFEAFVANGAIAAAHEMKDAGVKVYSVGTFEGANPDAANPDAFNRYMNAVSSNYPDATGYSAEAMGDRVAGAEFYHAVSTAEEMDELFEGLARVVALMAARVPTHIEQGFNSNNSGYVTFVDQLGDYMKVDSILSVVYQGQVYANQNRATAVNDEFVNNAVVVNQLGDTVAIGSVVISVERSDDPKVGDIVTVKIPASLIPLTRYEVDVAEDGTVTATYETASPIRVFYTVSLKDEVESLLADPDEDMLEYIEKNTVDGSVAFYASSFDPEVNAYQGSTYAHFTPALTNNLYYLAEDTPLYTDPACTVRATSLSESATYYYPREYYVVGENDVKVAVQTLKGSEIFVEYLGRESAGLYLKKGAPLYTETAGTLAALKSSNPTETSATYGVAEWLNPNRNGSVHNHLGNNGRILIKLPGSVTVTKNVVIPEAYQDTVDANQEFPFAIELKDAQGEGLTESFAAKVFDESGAQVGAALTIRNGSAFVLEGGQTLRVYNLPEGATYRVQEKESADKSMPAGFKQTAVQGAVGTISAGTVASAVFTNTYSAESVVLVGADNLKGVKTLSGRAWNAEDEFAFVLVPLNSSNPMPRSNEVVVNGVGAQADGQGAYSKSFAFGNIKFETPGVYVYEMYETVNLGAARVPGVTYSKAVYEVIVTVVDDGAGKLSASAVMINVDDDAGSPVDDVIVEQASFVNTFDMNKVSYTIHGKKVVNDMVGDFELVSGMFAFDLRPVGGNAASAPMPEGTTGVGDNRIFRQTNSVDHIHFGPMVCSLSKDEIQAAGGKVVYAYEVTEVAGSVPGVTYDASVQTVNVEVTWDDENGIVFKIVYPGTEYNVIFENAYALDEVTLQGETALKGVKELVGRDLNAGEVFEFTAEPADEATENAIGSGAIVFEQGALSAQVDSMTNGTGSFSFGDITFFAKGVYRFGISEVVPANAANGMTYDANVAVAVVTVADGGAGKLVASVSYDNSLSSERANRYVYDKAMFTNVYAAETAYGAAGGLTVTKTLTGADMDPGQFSFIIAASGNAPAVSAADALFTSGAHAAGELCTNAGKLSSLEFTQADDGKTYVYTVRENTTGIVDDDAEAGGLQFEGITYDQSVFEVAINVNDSGDGTLFFVTTVTKVIDAQGQRIAEGSRVSASYDSRQGEVPRVDFVNAYAYSDIVVNTNPAEGEAYFTKLLKGRTWDDEDAFTFQMTAVGQGVPMPEGAVNGMVLATATKPAEGNVAGFGFGSITFAEPGVYTYEVVEIAGSEPGMTYSTNRARMTVSVTDDGKGNLVAAVTVTNGAFENSFTVETEYTAVGGLAVTKVLNGRDMLEGQFSFMVVPESIEAMNKLGFDTLQGMTFRNRAGADGEVVVMLSPDELKLTQDDIGKTYAVTFSEISGDVFGYTYDTNKYRVSIGATLSETDELVVTTTVETIDQSGVVVDSAQTVRTASSYSESDGYAGTVSFVNSYEAAPSSVTVTGTKTLDGRTLYAGEFGFAIAYAADANRTPLAYGTNAGAAEVGGVATGSVLFDDLSYTLESVRAAVADGYGSKATTDGVDTYTINYIAYETTAAGNGITHVDTTSAFAVEVVDNGIGDLEAQVKYPEGGIAFKNAYSTGGPIPFIANGLKVLESADGMTPSSIEGLFAFTISSETEGAPLPAVTSVTNDAYGNVVFGGVEFILDMLDGVEPDEAGVRTKDFVYTVVESGSAPGVTNDPASAKTFTLTLVDDGDGVMSVVWGADGSSEGFLFRFRNTYSVEPVVSSVTDQIVVSKQLNGRAMAEGEFSFELLEGDTVVATATNGADGSVYFGGLTYTAPGVHSYTIKEVAGSKGGVTYDSAVYAVTTTVTDDGDGTLSVAHALAGGVEAATFVNGYTATSASASLGASKVLEGRDLVEGEFSFEIVAATEGAPMPAKTVVTNAADGSVSFGSIAYDAVGQYSYIITEQNGSLEGVTYDTASYLVVVTVADSGEGYLEATVEYPAGMPTFINKYEAPVPPTPPVVPDGPDDPDKPLADTGDATPLMPLAFLCMLACAALMVLRPGRFAAQK